MSWNLPKPPREWKVKSSTYQPARAVTVYALIALMLVAYLLGGIAFAILYHRTQAVCGPLRQGAKITTTSKAGPAITDTFGASADKLGCKR